MTAEDLDAARTGRLVHGTWQHEGDVKNLIAGKLEDLTPMLGRLTTESKTFI